MRATRKSTHPKKSKQPATAIVPIRRDEPEDSALARTELPLAFLATASKVSLQQFWINRLASAEGFQRAAADAMRAAVEELVAAKMARLGIDGILEQTELPKNEADEKLSEEQRTFLRIRAEAILKQDAGQFQPYFQPRALSEEIMRQVKVDRKKMWRLYFKLYGCVDCKSFERPHGSLGFCQRCLSKITARWNDIAKCPGQFED